MKYDKIRYASPLGTLILVADQEHLLEIRMTDEETDVPDVSSSIPLQETVHWLNDYFSGNMPSPETLQLHPDGTSFRQEVWAYLLQIPYGQTVTYGQLAAMIARNRGIRRMSAQAVGQAVAANPIPIIIPCHRVVGAKGDLVGYSCGLTRKLWLLTHEKQK